MPSSARRGELVSARFTQRPQDRAPLQLFEGHEFVGLRHAVSRRVQCRPDGKSPTCKMGPEPSATARSIAFSSSRIFPGQS